MTEPKRKPGRLHRVLPASAVFCCLVASTICFIYAAPRRPPVVWASPPLHDFGSLRQSDVVEAVFEVHNGRSEEVEILGVEKSCSCESVELPEKTIRPGTSVVVKLRWKLSGKSGATRALSTVVWRAASPNPAVGRLSLAMSADVAPNLTLQPPLLEFSGDASASAESRLVPLQGTVARIKRITSRRQGVVGTIVAADRVAVRFDPARYRDEGSEPVVEVESDDEHCSLLELRVKVRAQGGSRKESSQ